MATMSLCPFFSAHARGVAHGSASASAESAPRSNTSFTSSRRPHRHAHRTDAVGADGRTRRARSVLRPAWRQPGRAAHGADPPEEEVASNYELSGRKGDDELT